MKYNKFVAPVLAGALTLSLGLVGCGGSNSQSAASASSTAASATTDTTAASSASTTAQDSKVMFWMGMTEKDDTILYGEDEATQTVTILLFGSHDGQDELLGYSGPAKVEGEMVTITDTETGKDFTFKVSDRSDTSMFVDLGEHGKGMITAVTEKEFEEKVNSIKQTATEIGEALKSLDEKDIQQLVNTLDAALKEADATASASSSSSSASASSSASTTN